MSERPLLVLDASVGVKWFKGEPGSPVARELLEQSASGEIELVVPAHFAHEVLAVVGRIMGPNAIPEAWQHLKAAGLSVVPLSDAVVAEAAAQCGLLGCSFYDSLAPACAALLDCELASADARAHRSFPRVRLLDA